MPTFTLPEGCPKHSPWGQVQDGIRYTDEVFWVSTPSHGGFKVKAKASALIPNAFHRSDGWYEEDVDWAILVWFLDDLDPENRDKARTFLRSWRWREWELLYGDTIPLEESAPKAEAQFLEAQKDDLLVTAAFGNWHDLVPTGMVGVVATVGASREPGTPKRHFLVPSVEYDARHNRPCGHFVVDPTRHQEVRPF
jgi:hypothetical protein